jgi:YD repeat-containing protein
VLNGKARRLIHAATAALLLCPLALHAATVSYSYDDLHRLIAADYPNGARIEYSYDPAGNMTQRVVVAGELDTDGDGIPDSEDPDDDNDGYLDEKDAFPLDPDEWLDTDGDGIGNNADTDDDDDGHDDGSDNCALLSNPDQADLDGDGIGDVCDSAQALCGTDGLTIDQATFVPGDHALASEHSIGTHGAVAVEAGASLSLQAPALSFAPGFRVALGAALQVQVVGVSCSAGAAEPRSDASTAGWQLAPDAETLSGARHLAATEPLPERARVLLAIYGVDLGRVSHLQSGPDGWWLLFESADDLSPADRNGQSDIYRLDLLTETLALVSRTPAGRAGNGPSRYPATDASGELVVFESDADDLVEGDENDVSDIFLHDVPIGETLRLTVADGASTHPALDAAGEDLLYDQRGADGPRQVMIDGLWDGRTAEPISLAEDGTGRAVDNHHPAISADGRFVAYLEVRVDEADPGCQVHLYDRDSGAYHRSACPQALATAPERARPAFAPDAAAIEWHLPDRDAPVVVPNPLLDAATVPMR